MSTKYYYITENLKPSEYHTCPSCKGSGFIELQRDLHRSGGIIPCLNCHNGVRKTRVRRVND